MIYVYFSIIALMRAVQTFSNKETSLLIKNTFTMMRFSGYHNVVSALIAFIVLALFGFSGFDIMTFVLALGLGLFITLSLLSGIAAMKNCTIVLANMAANAGLIIPSVFGSFIFGEKIKLLQWGGIVLFFIAAYFLISTPKNEKNKLSLKSIILLIAVFLSNGFVMLVQKFFAVNVPLGNVTSFSLVAFCFNAIIIYLIIAVLQFKKRKSKLCVNSKYSESNEDKPLTGGVGATLKPQKSLGKKLLIYGALLSVALFAINQLITLSAQILPSTILFSVASAISLTVTAIVGAIIYKEKLTLKVIIGIALSILSVIIINL